MRAPRWWRRLRNREHRRSGLTGPLREFVYLDEVSVYSLLASRRGAVVSELTETLSLTTTAEVGGSARASAGVLGSDVQSKMQDSQTSGTQVVRKAIVQASFKELIELQHGTLALRPHDADESAERPRNGDEFEAAAADGRWRDRVLDAGQLRRGDLIEMRVELEAAPIFRFGATISSLIDMFKDTPELMGLDARAGMAQGVAVSKVLDALLAGLVPIRGRCIEFRHVTIGERSWVVHNGLLGDLVADETVEIRPLYLVGVAEAALFWKDIRRLLFSHSSYTVLCRLGRHGTSNKWTPVKLVDVVREFLPDVARQIDDAQEGLLSLAASDVAQIQDARRRALADALEHYGGQRLYHAQLEVDAHVDGDAAAIAATLTGSSVETMRQAFAAIDRRLSERHDLPPDDALRAAERRAEALAASGLEPDGTLVASPVPRSAPGRGEPRERYLDSEFIAIYW